LFEFLNFSASLPQLPVERREKTMTGNAHFLLLLSIIISLRTLYFSFSVWFVMEIFQIYTLVEFENERLWNERQRLNFIKKSDSPEGSEITGRNEGGRDLAKARDPDEGERERERENTLCRLK